MPRPPCLVMVAPNGARLTRRDHPALPVRAHEVAEEALACLEAGAAAIHLHARDGRGRHSLSPSVCASYLEQVRQRVGGRMLVQLTTEAVGRYTVDQQMALVRRLKPDAVSLALREIVPDEAAEEKAEAFLGGLARDGIEPQYILYEPAEVERFHALRRKGIVPGPRPFVLFVLGRYLEAGQEVVPEALHAYLAAHDRACPWMVCAFGRNEFRALELAASLGGHVRVGFENSLVLGNGTTAPSNAAKVAEVAAMLERQGRDRLSGTTASDGSVPW